MKSVLLAAATLLLLTTHLYCQRDYFTPEEIDVVRDAQQIDTRIAALTHVVDRRFATLKVDVKAPPFKESPDWGTAPSGSRLELFIDIKRVLEKAVDDIDNLSERPTSMVIIDTGEKKKKKPEGFAELFPKAVRDLAAAARRYQPALKGQLDVTQDPAEKGAILGSLELCDEIIASVAKLPAPPPPDPKKGKN